MFSDAFYTHYYPDPCCSTTVVVPDTMCDSMLKFENGFQQQQQQQQQQHYIPTESFDFQPPDVEMDLLMQTLEENPDFFDSTPFPVSPSSTAVHRCCYESDFKGNHHQQQMFSNEFYQPGSTSQTPATSINTTPPETAAPAQFEEFSLATQLPILNGYAALCTTIDETTVPDTNFMKFPDLEPYSAKYFFTTPPNTPPSMVPVTSSMSMVVPSMQCLPQSIPFPATDPTPTIRKLLQQKKKRITAVPCHVNSVCTTCQTRTTSLWRRNHLGEIECNACNLYFRKNNCKRPVTLRKDEIMKRKRKPRFDSSHQAENAMASSTLNMKSTITNHKPSLLN